MAHRFKGRISLNTAAIISVTPLSELSEDQAESPPYDLDIMKLAESEQDNESKKQEKVRRMERMMKCVICELVEDFNKVEESLTKLKAKMNI